MPRLQVYLPAELYDEVKARGLPASELLQNAVRAEIRRQELAAEADRYLASLAKQVGLPSRDETTRAEAIARVAGRRTKRAG